METTRDMEDLLKDALDRVTDEAKLEEMKTEIRSTLNTLLDQLEAGDLFNTAALQEQFDEVIHQVNEAIGIDLQDSLNLDDVLETINGAIPQGAFPNELKTVFDKVMRLLERLDLDNVHITIKTVKEPVTKPAPVDSSNASSLFSSVGTSTLPTNFDVFDQAPSSSANAQAADPETEKLFDDVLTKVSDAFTPNAGLIDGFQEKLEAVLIEAGFYSDVEGKKDAFLAAISADGLTIEKIFQAVGDLVIGLIESGISAVMAILEFILDDLKEIATVIKDQLVGPSTDPILQAVFEQFGIENFLGDYQPGLLSLPVFLISAPFTLLSLAVTGDKPVFPTISQDADDDKENKINGVLQLAKILTPFIGLLSYKLSREKKYKYHAIGIGGFGDLYAIGIDVAGQVYGEPDSSKNLHKAYWVSQWVTGVGFGLLITGVKTYVDWRDEKTDSTLAHRVTNVFPGFQLLIELYNFAFSVALFASDEAEEDPRLKACYWLDSLPGILDGVISIAKRVPMNAKLESLVDNEELLEKITPPLDKIVEANYAWEEASFNDFYGALPAGYSDLKSIKESLNSLQASVIKITDLFNNTFLKQLKPDNATIPTNQALWDKEMAIVNLLTQINEKISRCKVFIDEHNSQSANIKTLLKEISACATGIQTEIKNKKPDFKTLATNGQLLDQLINPSLQEIDEFKNKISAIPVSILENRLLGLLFVENDPETAVSNDCTNADIKLDDLILDPEFINITTPEDLRTLTSTEYMVTLDVEKNFLLQLKGETGQLGLFPTFKPFRYQKNLFPLLQKQQVNLNKVKFYLQEAKTPLVNWSPQKAQADIKQLSKEIYKLESAFIVLNTIIQCVHGGLSINAGDKPMA